MKSELQTMPLRFRVWDKKENKFCAEAMSDGSHKTELNIWEMGWWLDVDDTDDFIISQDTGLKDKNGESIYTGDILFYGRWYIVVKYKDGEVVGYNPAEDVYYENLYNMQLQGNIWQNPELLEMDNE